MTNPVYASNNTFEYFVLEGLRAPYARQMTIDYLKSRFRYYEGQAGALWELENKRELTQAEKVRQQYYREHPSYE